MHKLAQADRDLARHFAEEIAAEANKCCHRSDDYPLDIEQLAFDKIIEAMEAILAHSD